MFGTCAQEDDGGADEEADDGEADEEADDVAPPPRKKTRGTGPAPKPSRHATAKTQVCPGANPLPDSNQRVGTCAKHWLILARSCILSLIAVTNSMRIAASSMSLQDSRMLKTASAVIQQDQKDNEASSPSAAARPAKPRAAGKGKGKAAVARLVDDQAAVGK